MQAIEIRGLWSLLGQTWGAKFYENYGTEPNEAWSSSLAHVELESARFALGELIKAGSGFPPTLPEFMAAARKAPRDVPIYDARGRMVEVKTLRLIK